SGPAPITRGLRILSSCRSKRAPDVLDKVSKSLRHTGESRYPLTAPRPRLPMDIRFRQCDELSLTMNTAHRKPLPGTALDYFDARAAVEALQPGAWDELPYTARVHAENLVRRAEPAQLSAYLRQ